MVELNMMDSADCHPNSLPALSSFFGEQIDEADTDSGKRIVLEKARNFLLGAKSLTSSSFPYKDIRAFIEKSVSVSDQAIVVKAAELYLLLLEKVSVAYNELTFSSCLHHLSRLVKDSSLKKVNAKTSKTAKSSSTGQLQIADFVHFWVKLTKLFADKHLDVNNVSVASLAIQGFGELIIHGRQRRVIDLGASGISIILKNCSSFAVISSLYKVSIPIARVPLQAANRRVLVAVIVEAAVIEQRVDLTTQSRINDLGSPIDEDQEMEEYRERMDSDGENDDGCPTKQHNTENCYPALRFLELCCLYVGERADDRTSTAKFVHEVISKLDSHYVPGLQRFLKRSSYCQRGTVRMLTIELAAILIQNAQENGQSHAMLGDLMGILKTRSQDRMATVRCKAMHLLTESLKSIPEHLREDVNGELFSGLENMLGRLRDEKARVRRSATEYLGYACRASVGGKAGPSRPIHDDDVDEEMKDESGPSFPDIDPRSMFKLLRQRCRDASALVRQTAVAELSESLLVVSQRTAAKDIRKLFELWADGVLPHVEDDDQRCREISVEKAGTVAFSGIEDQRKKTGSNESDNGNVRNVSYTSLFLSYIGSDHQSASLYGRQLITALCRTKRLDSKVVDYLCNAVKSSEGAERYEEQTTKGAWVALEATARNGKARDVQRKLGIKKLRAECAAGNANAFGISLQLTYAMNAESIHAMVKSVRKTLFPKDKTKLSNLTPQTIVAAIEFMASAQSDAGSALLDDCEALVLEAEENMLENVTAHILMVVGGVCASFKLQREPPETVLHFVEASASQVQKSSKIRALALSTLGNMCLCESSQDLSPNRTKGDFHQPKVRKALEIDRFGESLTRRFVALFVHELENATSSATRNNAVVVLCDLCRRYTSVVEPYIARLSALLTDPSEFVRVQVISSLVSLLQEDYIKIRTGALLYRIAQCILDSSETVRATAEYALLHVLKQKSSSALASSFVELVFVVNACTACNVYNQFASEKLVSSLKGFANCDYDRRVDIYHVFLQGMTTEQRIRLPGRLRSDVLAPILDEKLSVADPSVSRVLDDTLKLLSDDLLCSVSRTKGSADDESNSLGASTVEESQNQSQSGSVVLIQKVQALELRESTIPVLLELRKILERLRSPILKTLMQALCALLRPYRKNLETMIGDALARAEIAHEIAKPSVEKQQSLRNRMKRSERRSLEPAEEPSHNGSQEAIPKASAAPETPRASARKPPLERPSVPRSKRGAKRLRDTEENDNDEDSDEDDIQVSSSCRRLSMMDRIGGSPKLVALARRGATDSTAEENSSEISNQRSMFATTMARIEGEAKS